MKKIYLITITFLSLSSAFSQTNPLITAWLQNLTGIKGRHYVSGNYTPIQDNDSANVKSVFYSADSVYVRANGVPSYITGPFYQNPSITVSQNAIFRFPLLPRKNTGTLTKTSGGNIGIFINGVAFFDYGDGVSWKNSTNSLAGGPLGAPGDNVWNRDAVPAEKLGFDCAKGHPAIGNYHHHQNPSAFNLDLNVISTICNLYAADGLYKIDASRHSPLIGFAIDGFPVYGAYGYKNTDGTGGIIRMKSSFSLRNITTRTTYYDGTTVTPGPAVSTTYPLGYFREDYQYNATSPNTPDYLDDHNGRFCVTPEYPNGTYCYFATVDANWNSTYPYLVGPTYYGIKSAIKVTVIPPGVTPYLTPLSSKLLSFNGVYKNDATNLFWITSKEINCLRFEVEKSSNGFSFTKIGEVTAKGNTSKQQNYNFIDNSIINGYNYYRLKQVDADGKYSYSSIVKINANGSEFGIKIFPNPATDIIAVQINDILRSDIHVMLTDMQGKVVMKKDFYQGTTICFLQTNTLYEGIYTLTVFDNSNKQSFKVEIKK